MSTKFRASWIAALVFMVAVPAFSADKVTIREAIEPGLVWTFHHGQDIVTDGTATHNGQSMPFGQKLHSVRSGKAEVLTAAGGAPTSIRVTFGDDCETTVEGAGQRQKMPFPYAGKIVTITRADDGKVTDDFKGNADEASVGELHGMIEQEALLMPNHPVATGDEWSPDPAALARLMQLKGEKDRAGMTLKLLGVKEVGGRSVAEIKVSLVLQTVQQQIPMQVISQGMALVDLQTGHTVKTELKGATSMNGKQDAPDQNGGMATYIIQGKGTVDTSTSAEITAGGGGGHLPGPPENVHVPEGPVAPHAAGNGAFAGKYSDGKMTLELSEAADGYSGTIEMASQKYPATAKAKGAELEGTFEAGGNRFPFAATLDSGTLKFITGKATYSLKKTVANPLENIPANPLAPPNPLSPSSSRSPSDRSVLPVAVAMPTGFSELGATDNGKALYEKLANVQSVDAVVQQTGDALAKIFDEKPKFTAASVDAKSKGKGIAPFSGSMKGHALNGIVMFAIDAQAGASVSVIYTFAEATAAEVAALMAALPTQQKMQTVPFPDGSGSIDLPPGWTLGCSSAVEEPLRVTGPSGQTLFANSSILCNTLDGATMRLYRENVRRAKSMGMNTQGMPTPQGFFYAISTPDEVMKSILPEIHESLHRAGKDYTQFGKMIESSKADPNPYIPKAEAGIYYFHSTKVKKAGNIEARELVRVDTYPIGDGKDLWTISLCGYSAPDATFDRDLPLMKDIMNTFVLAPGALAKKSEKDAARLREDSERFQKNMLARSKQFQKEQEDRFNRFEANAAARQQARHNANSDFIEMIGGYRDVYDTATGKTHSVDYYNVNGITNGLNEAANDPNRFVQVPLRYQR